MRNFVSLKALGLSVFLAHRAAAGEANSPDRSEEANHARTQTAIQPLPTRRPSSRRSFCRTIEGRSLIGDVGLEFKLPLELTLDVAGFAGAFFDLWDVETLDDLDDQPSGPRLLRSAHTRGLERRFAQGLDRP